MKSRTASKCLGNLFAVLLMIAMAAPAHAEDSACSLARSAGKWSFTDQGTVISIGTTTANAPRTAVGVFTFDDSGNVGNVRDGVATSSLAGTVASETFSGTYTVNPDCTGTVSIKIFASGTEILDVTLNIGFDEDMKHMRGIFTSAKTPDGTQLTTVINLDARKQ